MKKKLLSRPVFGWVLYDFANSAYVTSVMSVIFAVYLAKVLVPAEGVRFLGFLIPGESVWGYLITTVMIFVLLLSPAMGALADRRAWKRRFLIFWTLLGGFTALGLLQATPGRLGLALVLVFVATLGYEMSLVFYNAFINDVAEEDVKGTVSGWGFALGYIGGGVCLALNLWIIAKPTLFGLHGNPTLATRVSFFLVGFWWLLFSIPTFLWVKDRPRELPQGQEREQAWMVIFQSFTQLKKTFLWILTKRDLGRFLLAYLLYNDGIQTVILMASIFGAKALGMTTAELGLCFLVIQFVAFAGASFFGPLADKWSHKKAVMTTLIIYSAVVTWAFFMKSRMEFWILGVVVGIILGGSQAATRSLFANLIPVHKSGELFAFYSVVGKAAALLGPFFFALFSQAGGLRVGVASLLVFFLLGGSILWTVNEKRGMVEATRLPDGESSR